jgi:hypothetical protein
VAQSENRHDDRQHRGGRDELDLVSASCSTTHRQHVLTLIAGRHHRDEHTLLQSTADTTRMTWLYCLVWCAVALGLLVFDRRLWTKPPGPVDDSIVLMLGLSRRCEIAPRRVLMLLDRFVSRI